MCKELPEGDKTRKNLRNEAGILGIGFVLCVKLQGFRSLLSSVLLTLGKQFVCEGLWGPGLAFWELVVPAVCSCELEAVPAPSACHPLTLGPVSPDHFPLTFAGKRGTRRKC